jgi:hypothetical protein
MPAMTPIAHAAHWFASLLYLVPVLVVVAALTWQARRDRRAGRAGNDDLEPTLDDVMDGRA